MKKNLFNLSRFNLVKTLLIAILFSGTPCLYAQTIFSDDFNRDELGSDWQADSWLISNGKAFNGYEDFGGALRTTNAYGDSSYVIETAAMGFTDDYYREFRITFGQADQLFENRTYVLEYTEYFASTLTLGVATDNLYFPQVLDEVAIDPGFSQTKWYKFKIARYKSGLIQVYIDKGFGYGNIPLLEAIDSAYQTLGHFGWHEYSETAHVPFYVDYIGASKPAIEKPAVREKPGEDSLIAQVSATSEKNYNVAKLTTGAKAYTDREYTITTLPSYLNGASFVQTAMDDKLNTTDDFLTLFLKKSAVVYIAYDPRALYIPEWLKSWTKTGDLIGTTDSVSPYLQLYSRVSGTFEQYPFPFVVGANLASPARGSQVNYLVIAIQRPPYTKLEAEDALVSGAVIANNHHGYSGTGFVDYKNPSGDYIEWTVDVTVPGTYGVLFDYSNGRGTNRPLQISVDGADISVLPFYEDFQPSWDSWASITGPKMFLSPGVHKIRATAIGFSGPNMDAMVIYYDSPALSATSARRDVAGIESTGKFFDNSPKVFPNPFVESVKIRYTLKEKAKVVLSIYSLQGQQLQLLVNGVKEKGTYEADINTARLSAGTYFYRLQTGDEVKTGKLVKE